MKRKFLMMCLAGVVHAVLLGVLPSYAFSEGIIGDTVDFYRYYPPGTPSYPSGGGPYYEGTAVVVDPGVEFTIDPHGGDWIHVLDIAPATVTLDIINNYILTGVTPLRGFRLTSLDYGGPITNVSVGVNEIGTASVTHGDDWIDWYFHDDIELPPSSSERFQLNVSYMPPPPSVAAVIDGYQRAGRSDYLAGWRFVPDLPIEVVAAGFWDYGADGIPDCISGSDSVGFSFRDAENGTVIYSTILTYSGTTGEGPIAGGEGQFRYSTLAESILLEEGREYLVTSWNGRGQVVAFPASVTTSPGIVYSGGGSVPGLSYQAFFGPNFKYYVVPEPGSLSLLALGGLAMIRRRRIWSRCTGRTSGPTRFSVPTWTAATSRTWSRACTLHTGLRSSRNRSR